MAGRDPGATLRSVADNPTGAGEIPVVSTEQVENVYRPGGNEHKPSGAPESPDVPGASRPGGPEGGAKGGTEEGLFPRPGGPEGVN